MGAPVGHTCPDINAVISDMTKVYDSLDFTNEATIEELRAIIKDASSEVFQFTDYFRSSTNPLEHLRELNSALRDWGYESENRVEELEKELSDLEEYKDQMEERYNDQINDLQEALDEAVEERNELGERYNALQLEVDRLHLLFENEHRS